ncbi:MAG: PQQ-dependent dehydrogenase, methanol/ethanol family [Bryobacteraceae bacterium]|nr:PQQ-dependent dehydrogenase, methanol/ethanol family [Bryobacteraceae bacterium]
MPCLVRFALFAMLAAPLAAQHGSSSTLNPFTGPQHAAAGAAIYRGKCAGCHGPDGGGTGAGPALNTGSFRRGGSDEALFLVITKGIPGTAMPAFSENALEAWQVITHLRSFSVARRAGRLPGNAEAGAALFSQHCASCHWEHAPDLSRVGGSRSAAELRESILKPHAQVAARYWQIRGRTRAGREVQGVRLNEDSRSVQYRDASGNLQSAWKKDLAEIQIVRTSPMPSFASKLSSAEVDDLVAHLATGSAGATGAPALQGGATSDRLRNAAKEPHNWLTYNGTYSSIHHSTLSQITPQNAGRLRLEWVWQANSLEKLEATPLVIDGVMYLTDAPNDVVALDARTGRVFWRYEHTVPPGVAPCCGRVNRGLGVLGHTLFLATLDARLIALDARTGRKRWDVQVADYRQAYSLTLAPLVVGDKVIVGPAGGELGIRGFVAAYDAATGREAWRFRTIPEPGEFGHETWAGDSWKHGGGPVWLTGSYDPELNLTYWGIGNPGPDWNPSVRRGDNLFTSSVVALDAATGKRVWHFQFTPNDGWDFDAVQIPVLADLSWKGRARKVMLWGNRNGFFYALDRTNGEFLLGAPFVKQTWAKALDERGRPIKAEGSEPSEKGTLVYPGVQGGTNWYAPSFSPLTGLFYLTTWDDYPGIYYTWEQKFEPGKWYAGGSVQADLPAIHRREPRTWGPEAGYGAVRALDPLTGKRVWEYRMSDVSDSGLLTTASHLLFSGSREGYFFALDARDGKELWNRYLGGQVASSPITWSADGRQYVTIASGHALFTFALPD